MLSAHSSRDRMLWIIGVWMSHYYESWVDENCRIYREYSRIISRRKKGLYLGLLTRASILISCIISPKINSFWNWWIIKFCISFLLKGGTSDCYKSFINIFSFLKKLVSDWTRNSNNKPLQNIQNEANCSLLDTILELVLLWPHGFPNLFYCQLPQT